MLLYIYIYIYYIEVAIHKDQPYFDVIYRCELSNKWILGNYNRLDSWNE